MLTNQFPKAVVKSNPEEVVEAYFDFLEEHEEDKDFEAVTSSVKERFDANYYNSIYKLFHDIKLSAVVLITSSKLGTEKYLNIDHFYKFATEIILQEASRLHLNLKEFQQITLKAEKAEEENNGDFEKSLVSDFSKISTSFRYPNGEAFFVLTGQNNSLPLFSSLSKKSELDGRNYPLPDSFKNLKVLPNATSVTSTNLAFISPNPTKVPSPDVPPTEITRHLFHPNWISLPSIPWLDFKSSHSFIPLIDETISVIGSKTKGKIYFEQVGLKKLSKLRDEYYNKSSKTSEEKLEPEEIVIDEKKEEADVISDKTNDISEEETPVVEESKTFKPGTLNIDLQNLYQWRPNNEIEDDEFKALEDGEEQKYINKLLIDLNKLRSERYLVNKDASKVIKPTIKETKVYNKIRRLLTGIVLKLDPASLVENGTASDTGLRYSKDIPVLSTNYSGSLAAPLPVQYNGRSTQRVQGLPLHRTYKKRK